MQNVKKIAALGPAGTYGHEAAEIARAELERRGISVSEVFFQPRNELIIDQVLATDCYGIIPIENATEGFVREVMKRWIAESRISQRSAVYVIGEVHLPIHHNLLARQDIAVIEELASVMSHPQALGQCSKLLNDRELSLQVPTTSTADAARQVATNPALNKSAAVASRFAAEIYGLKVLRYNIEDSSDNMTRFHILGATPVGPTGHDRTAIVFHLPNKQGVLDNVIHSISEEGVNMSSIHSIPLGSMNEYAFYIEIDCHMSSDKGRAIKKKIELHTINPLILGSYPREKREV